MYQCPRPGRRWNGRTDEVLITVWYGMVRYGTVLPLRGEGMLVCMYVCVRARVLGWAVLGGAGLGGAVLGGAGFIVGV